MAEAAQAGSGPLSKGSTIGRYLVLSLVGRGGMGDVYAAYDPELDRKVAVKLLRGHAAGTANPEGRMRLLREAQAIAKLSHPNVVVVYDVGTFRDGVFIAMEFVDGKTVGYWLQVEPRPWREVLKVFGAAGRGLLAAHLAGMVHRDFKPDNVMMTSQGQIRVMDFGLARQLGTDEPPAASVPSSELGQLVELGESASGEVDLDATAKLRTDGAAPPPQAQSGSYLRQKLTQTGALVGTPAYMAPEQFAGTDTDARTDQFSFCVALYEALYGQRPFEGDTVIALMANVVSGSVRAEPENTTVPGRLRKILLRGLAPEPSDRFATMADLLEELERDPATRRRTWIAGAAAVTTLAAALIVGGARLTSRNTMCAGAGARLESIWELEGDSARKQQIEKVFESKAKGDGQRLFASVSRLLDGYVSRWAAMYRDACEATHVRGDQSAEVLDLRMACLGQRLTSVKALSDVLVGADASVIENSVNAAGALPTLERCSDVAMLRSVVQPPSDAQARQRVDAIQGEVAKARALGDSGQCAQCERAASAALAAARSAGYLPLVAEAAYVAGESGKFCTETPVALGRLEEAVWAAEASQDDEMAVQASGSAAGTYADRAHDPRMARLWIKHAEAILKRLPGHPMLEIYTTVDRGFVDMIEGRVTEAVEEHKRALAKKEEVLGPLHPDTALSAMNVGLALHELGRDGEAEPFARRAVETLERLLGSESVQVATAQLDWAEVLTRLGRTREAREALDKAIAIWTRLGAAPLFIEAGHMDVARIELMEKRPAEARRLLEHAQPVLAERDAQLGAEASFLLADALWSTQRERARAVRVAHDAKQVLGRGGTSPARLAEVDAWLTQHVTP
jgi:tetratricopeptide (TPR) repeat protein